MTGSSNMDFIEGSVDTTAVEVTGTGEFSRQRQLDITLQANVSNVAEDVTDTTIVLKDSTGAVTGMAETDSNGVANDLLFTTQTVDSSGLTTKNLNGYTVWHPQPSTTTGPAAATTLLTSATCLHRWPSRTLRAIPTRCSWKTSSRLESATRRPLTQAGPMHRHLDQWKPNLQQRSCRIRLPPQLRRQRLGWRDRHDGRSVHVPPCWQPQLERKHVDSTASYDFDNANRMYPYFNGETTLYMHDATVTAIAVSSGGDPRVQPGLPIYSLNVDMNNTPFPVLLRSLVPWATATTATTNLTSSRSPTARSFTSTDTPSSTTPSNTTTSVSK